MTRLQPPSELHLRTCAQAANFAKQYCMLRLLHFPLDPFSRKVRIVLREKELDAELEAVEPWRQRKRWRR